MSIRDSLDDTAAVRTVLQKYIEGAGGRPDLLREAFHANAMMFGNMGAKRWDVPIAKFIDRVARAESSPAGAGYAVEIGGISVHGDAASATMIELDYFGMDFVNLFTLARFEDGWKIVSKTYTSPGARPG
jgi:hypothetical protein